MGRESVKFEAVLNFQSEARRKRVKEGRRKWRREEERPGGK